VTSHYSVSYDRIGKALDSPHIDVVSDRKKGRLYLLERLVLAMLTGNGDLHLENLSVMEKDGVRLFTPVYDPTPMRAYAIHNALTPNGMSFGDFGDYPDGWKGTEPVDFASAWKRFCKNVNISPSVFNDTVERLLLVTDNYSDRVYELKSLPDEHKRRLSDIHKHVRKQFMSLYKL
jgi:serine/threonine-protein kinase HipA